MGPGGVGEPSVVILWLSLLGVLDTLPERLPLIARDGLVGVGGVMVVSGVTLEFTGVTLRSVVSEPPL